MAIPAAARKLLAPAIDKAAAMNVPIYAVGGCVRDWILGRPTHDLDVVVEGDAEPLARAQAAAMGLKAEAFGQFRTLRVVGKNYRFDFAGARKESYPRPAALPVVEAAFLREDLKRRDFTINAMAVPLYPGHAGELVDPFDGLKDLKARILRVLHGRSFRDDPTRVFRAARFLCRFRMRPEKDLPRQARGALKNGHAALLSRHRLAHELLRVLAEPEPGCALSTLRAWGYLDLIHPKLRWRFGRKSSAPPGTERVARERLGEIVVEMGEEGRGLLESLPFERRIAAPVVEAARLVSERMAPRATLSKEAETIVKLARPDLPRAAISPAWLGGADLLERGLPPGPSFHEILNSAAAAQWRGEIKSRRAALSWLKRRLGKNA